MGKELELKLSLHPKWAETFRESNWLGDLSSEPVSHRTLKNTYFDTDDLVLNKQKVALRIREKQGQYIQTLKTKGTANQGLHNRNEWEWQLKGPQLNLALLNEVQTESKLEVDHIGELEAKFTTHFNRSQWMIRQGKSLIELVLDEGSVNADSSQDDLFEVELELKEGEVSDLYSFAESLVNRFPLVPSDISKAERGYYLTAKKPWVLPQWQTLSPDDESATAIKIWLQNWLSEVNFHWNVFISSRDYLALYSLKSCIQNMVELFSQSDALSVNSDILSLWETLSEYENLLDEAIKPFSVCIGIRLDEHTEGKGLIQRTLQMQENLIFQKIEKLSDSKLLGQWNLNLSAWLRDGSLDNEVKPLDVWVADRVSHLFWSLDLTAPHDQVSDWVERYETVQRLQCWLHLYQTLPNCPVWLPGIREQVKQIWRRLEVLVSMDESEKVLADVLSESDKNKLNSWQRRGTVILRELNQIADDMQQQYAFLDVTQPQ